MTEQDTARVRLDRGRIVAAMLQLAHDEPHERITFKRLGAALGVDATAMYRHFRNKEELSRAALDRLSGVAVAAGQATPGTWRVRLEAYLMRVAELALAHPSVAADGAIVDPAGPGDVAADEFVLSTLTGAGLAGEDLLDAYAALSGFAVAQSAAMAQEVLANRSAARDGSIPWIGTFGTVDLAAFPHVREHRDGLLAIDGITVYRAGIAAILDSIERAIDA